MNALALLTSLGPETALALRSNFSPEVRVRLRDLSLGEEPVAGIPGDEVPAPEAAPSDVTSDGGSVALKAVEAAQPTVDAILPDGSRLTIFAPYGVARTDYRVYVGGILVATVGSILLALALAYLLGYRRGRRARRS